MARPREFSETVALQAAINCFWQYAFGDKQTLYARALERYLDCTTRDRLRRYETSLPPKEAIHQFFAEIVDQSIKDRKRKGCFLVNSALEVAPHQSELGAVIAKQFADIEAFFKRCVLAAQASGTVPRGVDATNTARLLLGALLGIRVLARSASDRSLLEGVVQPALALLDLPRHKRAKRR